MKTNFDFTQPLKDFRGETLMDGTEPITFSPLSINALMGSYKDEENLPGIEKLKRYKLAEKIYDSPTNVELTDENKRLINELVGKIYGVIVVGNFYKFLEG
jgi:hypothetical protein